MKSISDLIDEYEASRNVGRDLRVGPSDYGKCGRQVAYRVRGHEPGPPIEKTRAATMGTLFWQGLGDHIAKTHPDALVEVRVEIPGLDRDGSADLVWSVDGVLVDVKTVSARAFDHVVTFGAKPDNVGQLETYGLGLNRRIAEAERLGLDVLQPIAPVHTLRLEYVNRDNGDVHPVEWAYDEQVARRKVSDLASLEQMIEAGFDLPRAAGARLGAFPCDWCPFWRECWDVPEGDPDDEYASKFTKTDAAVEEAIESYLSAGAVESEAKRTKAAARDRLVGIAYGANGYRLSWSGGRVTYVDEIDTDALVEQAQLAGLEIPMKTVEARTSRRINVGRSTA